MAKSSNLYIRVEPDVKEQAEKVFNGLGISMSNAVGLFLKQVVINQAIPFDLKLAPSKIKSFDSLTEAELDTEIEKGFTDYLANKGRPVKEVFSDIRKGLGV
ncbi:type II toxin-antitoxin system RelB/DinJ family antitoxin [Phosphitispora fastidiosa]|uniref:type II toxin-antitoxin system RelB/DinJ family antitoxin n=1 Tax=Phosphitispora fastidiosa TaxID=2837202 RepID=UPI001E2B02A9|nr:DNA-damage-inducible protein J [Phosphitispora fastidiosa]